MTAAGPEEREQDAGPYTGPPPTLPPPAELRADPPAAPEPSGEQPAAAPTPYLLAMRDAGWAWWRPLAGLAVIAFLLGIALVLTRIADLLTGTGADLSPAPLTWPGLLVTDLFLAVALPAVLLAWPIAHGVGPGRGLSEAGLLRLPLLRRLLLVALATAGVGIGLGVAGAVLLAGREAPGPVPELPWVLVVGLLTVPLRAAAEEVLVRGYLAQAVAGWIGRPRAGVVVAAVVTSVLWAAAYGTDDLTGFLGRLALGLAASAAVASTGGVEAAIALHVVVAVVVLVLGAVLGEDAVPGMVPGGPGDAFALVGALAMAAFVVAAGRRGART
ncbi:hypothetical protein DQ239_11230 [Blastococcus sp. TF02-09]|uniref:CPBP family glutamic-type intramembrane protease n=1 Tax=Blastococcus sp. TF02-09 TaxID=2250576 RepID=UPI000DEBA46E|nr:CPBP family glutamic-type intramembrane protease [Blastococcus sp. TF02-9]RBY77444.1 hypothetical protein DQ239_11230 [Blastococcus sp. TF02-9]